MLFCNCPRCNESVRLPVGMLPKDGYARCPWCDDTYPIADLLERLPPLVEISSADGQVLDCGNFGRKVVGHGLELIEPDESHDAYSEAMPSLVLGPEHQGDSEAATAADDMSNPFGTSPPHTMPMRVQSNPEVSLRHKPQRSSPLRTIVQIALGPLIAIPLAGLILLMFDRAPKLGFYPFDGSFNRESSQRATPPDPSLRSARPVAPSRDREFVPRGRSLLADPTTADASLDDQSATDTDQTQSAEHASRGAKNEYLDDVELRSRSNDPRRPIDSTVAINGVDESPSVNLIDDAGSASPSGSDLDDSKVLKMDVTDEYQSVVTPMPTADSLIAPPPIRPRTDRAETTTAWSPTTSSGDALADNGDALSSVGGDQMKTTTTAKPIDDPVEPPPRQADIQPDAPTTSTKLTESTTRMRSTEPTEATHDVASIDGPAADDRQDRIRQESVSELTTTARLPSGTGKRSSAGVADGFDAAADTAVRFFASYQAAAPTDDDRRKSLIAYAYQATARAAAMAEEAERNRIERFIGEIDQAGLLEKFSKAAPQWLSVARDRRQTDGVLIIGYFDLSGDRVRLRVGDELVTLRKLDPNVGRSYSRQIVLGRIVEGAPDAVIEVLATRPMP